MIHGEEMYGPVIMTGKPIKERFGPMNIEEEKQHVFVKGEC